MAAAPVLASSSPPLPSTATAASNRLIEYPADLSGCSSLPYGGRQLLYLCSHESRSTPFVVVLGFFSGQKHDVITKDLIEPVAEQARVKAKEAVSKSLAAEYSEAHIFFL